MNCGYIFRFESGKNSSNYIAGNDNYRIRVLKAHQIKRHYFLKLLSLYRLREYQLLNDNDEVVSYAIINPKIFLLKFMVEKDSLHIGGCFTKPEFRGKGLYPYLLSRIVEDYHTHIFYMFCDIDNIASKRGILKAGFSVIGEYTEKKVRIFFKNYNIIIPTVYYN